MFSVWIFYSNVFLPKVACDCATIVQEYSNSAEWSPFSLDSYDSSQGDKGDAGPEGAGGDRGEIGLKGKEGLPGPPGLVGVRVSVRAADS